MWAGSSQLKDNGWGSRKQVSHPDPGTALSPWDGWRCPMALDITAASPHPGAGTYGLLQSCLDVAEGEYHTVAWSKILFHNPFCTQVWTHSLEDASHKVIHTFVIFWTTWCISWGTYLTMLWDATYLLKSFERGGTWKYEFGSSAWWGRWKMQFFLKVISNEMFQVPSTKESKTFQTWQLRLFGGKYWNPSVSTFPYLHYFHHRIWVKCLISTFHLILAQKSITEISKKIAYRCWFGLCWTLIKM